MPRTESSKPVQTSYQEEGVVESGLMAVRLIEARDFGVAFYWW
jgi:hypothetical protein